MDISAVSICSNALLLNGEDPIDSFDVDNNRTRLVANLYAAKRDKVLRAHPWNCAVKRVVLSPDAAACPFDWRYQTQLPADCLRVLNVGLLDAPEAYEVAGRKVLTDTPLIRLRYVWRNDDESTWDALLVEAMTQVMVVALAFPLTHSTSKEELENAIVRDLLKTARAVDGQENPPEQLGDLALLNSRLR